MSNSRLPAPSGVVGAHFVMDKSCADLPNMPRGGVRCPYARSERVVSAEGGPVVQSERLVVAAGLALIHDEGTGRRSLAGLDSLAEAPRQTADVAECGSVRNLGCRGWWF